MLVIDSHCDTPSQLLRCRNIHIDNEVAQVDFPKLREGGVSASFFALFVPSAFTPDQATAHALKMLAAVKDAVDAEPSVSLATSPDEVLANHAGGNLSVCLGMENGSPIQESLSLLRQFYRMGVRYMTLTHNGDNAIADAASNGTTWNGLSPFGREVVAEMNRLGMIIDVAHASDKTFYDCIKYSKAPIVSTHSCCRALCGHRRNFTDDMLKAIADVNGVMQVNFYPVFLSESFSGWYSPSEIADRAERTDKAFRADPSDPVKSAAWIEMQKELNEIANRPGVEAIVDHIDHAVEVAGVDHVGIGSDYDGIEIPPRGMENVSKMGLVFGEMRRRGYGQKDVEKVAGLNFLRVWRDVESVAKSY